MESQLGKPPTLSITAKLYFTNGFCLLLQTRILLHPIYQLLLEGGYDPLVLSAATERMLQHPIYQLPLKGGYDPLVLSAATKRMLRNPIYQLPLEGGYNPFAGM